MLLISRGNAWNKSCQKEYRFTSRLYKHNILFFRNTVLCGKGYLTANRKAAIAMDNHNEKVTILLVDDEETVLGVGSSMIQKLGYKVLQATTGTEAVQIYKENMNDICLVILDQKLPDEPGSNTCKRLKELKPDVKVLHTSGLGTSFGDDSFECGCDTFLIKPFRLDELSNKLKELLENT